DWLGSRLPALGLPADVVECVLALVGAHHDPKLLVVRDAPTGAWWRVVGRVDPRLVYLLELADMMGRACPDRTDQIELIELFRLGCEERGLFCAQPLQPFFAAIEAATDDWPERDRVVAVQEGLLARF